MARSQGRNALRRQFIETLNELLPPQVFAQFEIHGNTRWPPQKLVWVGLLMNWLPGASLSERFHAARRLVKWLRPRWDVPTSYSGFADAQWRWWPLMQQVLFQCLRPDERFGQAWRVRGWLVFAVDGSRFECPRTTVNERELRCAGREKTGPQIFQTTLQHVGTGLPWDVRLGPGTDSERRHLDDMLPGLPPQSLLTADAGFISYDLVVWLCQRKQTFVLRVGANFTLLTGLGWEHEQEGSTVYLWPQDRRKEPPVVLRRVEFRSSGGLPVVLLTNELDATRLSDEDLRTIYAARWGIELYYRSFKQTWGFRGLLSRTPEMVLNEQSWRILGLWLLQSLAARELHAAGQDPRRFSPAQARQAIREFLQDMQQGAAGASLRRRLAKAQTDDYKRTGPKATRTWPRKKTQQPPQPPKVRPATQAEIDRAKEVTFLLQLNC